jgi:hypothetical protein
VTRNYSPGNIPTKNDWFIFIFKNLKPSKKPFVNNGKELSKCMETNKVLAALSYFSILFAGFIFPLVVYFVTDDSIVKKHAKKAFLSHLIPLIPIPLIFIVVINDITGNQGEVFPILLIVAVGLSMILSLVVLIWNIIKGVKVLKTE